MARVATADGYEVHAEAHGEGLPVLLSCGMCTNSVNWQPQIEPFVAAGLRLILWDFRGHSAQTTEKVPGGRAQMNGYLESSHYKEALGDTILERIFDPAAPERHGDGFGVRLRPGNIEPHLSRLRAERAHYLSRNREVQLWAERLARSTAPGRKAACRRARRASG